MWSLQPDGLSSYRLWFKSHLFHTKKANTKSQQSSRFQGLFKVPNQKAEKFRKIFIKQVSTGSIIIYTKQKILYMSNWILRFQNGFYKVLIDLRVIQFLCKIMRLVWKSDYVPFQFKIAHGSNQNIHFAELYALLCLSNVFFYDFDRLINGISCSRTFFCYHTRD